MEKCANTVPVVPAHVRVISVTDLNGKERKLYIPATLDLDRPKRPRTTFSTQQLQILEMEFRQNHFVTETRRHALALVLHLSETQIKVWFQNRRTKLRRRQEKLVPEDNNGGISCCSGPVGYPGLNSSDTYLTKQLIPVSGSGLASWFGF